MGFPKEHGQTVQYSICSNTIASHIDHARSPVGEVVDKASPPIHVYSINAQTLANGRKRGLYYRQLHDNEACLVGVQDSAMSFTKDFYSTLLQ